MESRSRSIIHPFAVSSFVRVVDHYLVGGSRREKKHYFIMVCIWKSLLSDKRTKDIMLRVSRAKSGVLQNGFEDGQREI